MSTWDAIRRALTGSQDPLTVFEIVSGTDLSPHEVRHELVAMQQVGEVEAVWPSGPGQTFWALTADTTLRRAVDDLEGSET